MPYIPHTDSDVAAMLDLMKVKSIEALFDEIPSELRCEALKKVPTGMTELELNQWLSAEVGRTSNGLCFVGAGAYEHHIPAAVWDIASRGEYLTAYTPYQAEASQGTLQLLYEYQTMMASLTGMDVSNASLYDGASALAEAVLMAVRAKKIKSRCVVVASCLHPHYRDTVNSIVCNQGIELIELPFDETSGCMRLDDFSVDGELAAVVIQQPNFFGNLEDVDTISDWAKKQGALVIGSVNPTSLALLKPPSEWGEFGADIVCGEGQPLGVPLASGGPYFGFLCCRKQWVRQLPGRLIGATTDLDGKRGFSLTLQAREQHIRRSKATSNICTNQGLLVTAATIYMSLLGAEGLAQVAKISHQMTVSLVKRLVAIDGVSQAFDSPYFHECAIRVSKPVREVLAAMQASGFLAGLDLGGYYPQLADCLLLCVTETKTEQQLDDYAAAFAHAMS